jgi:hypothetical protein
MSAWKIGIAVGPCLIVAMAILMRRQKAITRNQMLVAIGATCAIAAVFLTM